MSSGRKNIHSRPVRLQVLLARCGFGSRRACEEFIEAGRGTVDGETVSELGARVDVNSQKVEVDGESIRPERAVCYMVNKPKGMLCTNRDPAGRPRVIDLFPPGAGHVFPIGRLDENSVGLLLVTNDGDLSHQLAHPRFRVPKVYQVHVAGNPTRETLQKLRQGMYFSEGRFKVDRLRRIRSRGQSTILEVTLSEGQNREIRRLFARVGHKVMRLERVAFGPLHLRNVASGRYRKLTRDEMKLLNEYLENGGQESDAEAKAGQKESGRRHGSADTAASAGRGTASGGATTGGATTGGAASKPAGKKAVKNKPRVVEVSPVATPSGHDIAGRKKKSGRKTGRPNGGQPRDPERFDEDEERVPLSQHPVLLASKQSKPEQSKQQSKQQSGTASGKARTKSGQVKKDSPSPKGGGRNKRQKPGSGQSDQAGGKASSAKKSHRSGKKRKSADGRAKKKGR